MTNHCYFADYDIIWGGQLRAFGHTTLVYPVADGQALDPADLVARLHQKAADTHDVTRSEVRLRLVQRL